MANTTNLDLVKPAGTDHALISVLNSNSDKIDAFAGKINDSLSAEQNGLAYIVGNTNTTGGTLAVGQFVYVKGHSTIPEGLRKVTSSISANGSITTSNTAACSEGGLNALNSNITPSAVSVSPTYNSNIHNQELTLQTIGKLVVGYLIFSYNSSFTGGDGRQEIIINNNGLPPASGGNQLPVTCVAGSSAGQTGRVRVTANGHLQFFYSNLKGKAGETYLVYLNYIAG